MARQTARRGLLTTCCGGLCLGLLAWGCGGESGPARHPVSGTVTFDGKPLPEGTISFLSSDGSASDAGFIKDGKYSLKATEGSKRVEIRASRPSGEPVQMPSGTKKQAYVQYADYVPKKYNKASELKADVKAGGENTYPFDLKSE